MTLEEADDGSSQQREKAQDARTGADHPLETTRARRALISNMRHELRTPINAILGYSEMLVEDAQQLGYDSFIADLQKINTAGKRLLALLDDLLDPAKIEAGKVDVTSEAFGAHVRHELRTPLNAVIGYSEMLLEAAEDAAQDDLIPDLRKVHTAGQRLFAHLEDVINLSKIEAGKTILDLEASGESSMVRDVVTTIRSLYRDDLGAAAIETGSLLIVDDNEMNRDMLSRHLQRQGYEVSVAENGRRALDLIGSKRFDLVLLDMVMPEMNGYQVLQRLKTDVGLRHIPVIMISALDETDAVVRCIEMGADDYLPKPFNPILLKARIGACLEKKRLRDREQEYLEQLRLEREKSERLLLNVLPQPIAERLKRGEAPIADSFAEATVLFADLVGFTQISSVTPPKELVAVLNHIFSALDHLGERHGLEKIKTIGDAYMAVAGLPTPRADHVEAAAEMALDILQAVAQVRAEIGKPFSIRIGMNSGPVVAGVIGRNKFAYDLWGDTVNTASRMESHGVPDHVAVTAAVYERLRGRYVFEPRGMIEIKNKGQMPVYLLKARG
ncbi:MAG: response regulator [Chloroflexi bacterium]|nr:response regulator [Chloroflexota bacterium]